MCYIDCTTLLCIVAAESNLAETAVSTVAAGSVESIDAVESDGGAESDFAVVKEHIKQQGSVDVLSLKLYL